MSADDSRIRLSALLSKRGVASRREAERLIEEGRVLVDGEPVREQGVKVDPDQVRVEVDGREIPREKSDLYLALNKPPGFLSAFTKGQEKGQTLASLVPKQRKLVVAGRLDRASSGLLLLTTDGDWANRVMHPRYGKEKEYLVRFGKLRPTPAAKKFAQASFREAGREFRADRVEPAGSFVRVILREGRKNQIRRLADAVDLEIRELIRVRVGDVELGPLPPGRHRPLSRQEVKSF